MRQVGAVDDKDAIPHQSRLLPSQAPRQAPPASALGRRGINVDRHKIDLDEPLKMLGTYKVAIRVFPGLTPEVTIAVEPKG